MKRTLLITVSVSLAWASLAPARPAEAQAPPVAAPAAQKTLAATINIYVFPADGQASDQQNRHEAECYAWAVNNTKSDPFDLVKQAEQAMMTAEEKKAQVEQQTEGAGAKSMVRGAAVGALIGEIADNDAGGGAAWGAAAGLISGRRRARQAKQQADQQIEAQAQQVQQASAEQIEGFKKAFSVCLEAKKYLVRF